MDPVSMLRHVEKLIGMGRGLLRDGGAIDAKEFEAFRAASLQLVGLLFDDSHPRCQGLVKQEGRGSREAAEEDVTLLEDICKELHYHREMGF